MTAPTCRPWCREHLHCDGVLHLSTHATVSATSGPERATLTVSVERTDSPPAVPSVRLEGAHSAPMTPVQALHLSSVLQAAAFAALLDGGLDDTDTMTWARALAAEPATALAYRYGLSVSEADRLRSIVADLLDQAEADTARQRAEQSRRRRRFNSRRI